MPDEQSQCVLRFEHVSVMLDQTRALDDVSFEVLPGESLILFGAAGSGKTVLLKVAIGLIRPSAGRICLLGRDITELKERELFEIRAGAGVLFQEGGLFDSLTIEENVGYPLVNQKSLVCPPEERHRRVEEALRFVELEHTLEKFPSELSGGMRRRVGIARAVVTEPRLVLYDSPTAGLDPITAYTIIALIVKERDMKNTTTVMVTHRYQDGDVLAKYRYDAEADHLERTANGSGPNLHTKFMVLREGRLVFQGSQAELEASTDPYVSRFVKRED